MSCIAMRGGLKSGDRVGTTKKRVHFLDDDAAKASINYVLAKVELEEDVGAQTQPKGCGLTAKSSILQLQDSCRHVIEEESNSLKNATPLCAVGEASLSTPPQSANYELTGPHGVAHLQFQGNNGVQRKLTFGAEYCSEQSCRKPVFMNKKNFARSQNYEKVVPEIEGGVSPVNVMTPHDLYWPMQASSLAMDDSCCKKRCAWITPHSDRAYVAYHDEEWGVPVHDDRRLFELLVFAGSQAEVAWSTLLARRESYRDIFDQFDPVILATYDMTKMASLRSHNDIMRSEARIQSIVNNAKLVVKIAEDYGSFDAFLWGFVGNRAIVNRYKQANLIPVRTGKSEALSKDLQRRGFRHAGPIVIYSLMQAAGLANDHLLSCFRHHALLPPSASSPPPPPKPARPASARKPLVSPLCC